MNAHFTNLGLLQFAHYSQLSVLVLFCAHAGRMSKQIISAHGSFRQNCHILNADFVALSILPELIFVHDNDLVIFR